MKQLQKFTNKNYLQQLEFIHQFLLFFIGIHLHSVGRCVRSTNTRAKRTDEVMNYNHWTQKTNNKSEVNSCWTLRQAQDRLTAEIPQLWVFRKDCLEIQRMILYPLFCGVKPRCFLSVFPSLLSINSLTHKINFHRDLDFGYRQWMLKIAFKKVF